ncbi:MAG: lamin tail domain-containing protein [Anaerolineae bacterium]|nr:MAG: lamin tail domain-containing protein [Anaerolineae bacterium]
MKRRQLLFYLLLNIFVSACVTGLILFWYDRTYRAPTQPVAPVAANAPLDVTQAEVGETVPVEIVSVVGAGTLGAETVLIRYNGEGELDMTNWQIRDEDGNTFTFPRFKLYPQGSVQVYTMSGSDTAVALYWGRHAPIWESGETVRLYDASGTLRAEYVVP